MKKAVYVIILITIVIAMLLNYGAYNLGNITFGKCILREAIGLLIGWFILYRLEMEGGI